jgi:MFS family permease
VASVSASNHLSRIRLVQARWAIIAIFLVNGTGLASWMTRVPAIKDILGASKLEMSWVLWGPAFGAIISFPITGYLLGRFGSRPLTIIMALLTCICLALVAFGSSIITFFLLLFIFGFCNASMDVCMNAQAADVEEKLGIPIMSSFHGVFSVGSIVGALLGGLFASRGIGLFPHLPIVAGLLIILLLIASRFLLPTVPQHSSSPVFALPSRAVFIVGLIGFCALVGEGAMGDWSALYLRDVVGTTEGFAAYGYAAFAVAMTVGRFVGDGLTKAFGPKRLIIAGGLLAAVGLAFGLLTQTVWSSLFGFAAVGLGLSIMFPIMVTIATQQSPNNTGPAIAAVTTMGYTGFLVGAPLIGFISQYTTLSWGLSVIVLMSLGIVALASRLKV